MTGRRPGLGPVLLVVFLDLLGFGIIIPLLSFYAESLDASPLEVTLLMTAFSAAQFLGAPLWGVLSDRWGRRPVLLVTVALTAIFLALFASADTLTELFVYRALHGFAAANISTAQAYVADVTTGDERTRGMGLIGAAFGVGFSLGPFVGGQFSVFGLAAPFWVAAALSAVNFVWVAVALPESRTPGTPRPEGLRRRALSPGRLLDGLRHPVVGGAIGLVFMVGVSFAMLESTFSLVAEHVWGYGPSDVGNLFGLIGVIGIVVQGGLIGRLAKAFGELALVVAGFLLGAAGMLILGVTSGGAWVWIGCAVVALGTSSANPALNALISRGTSEDEQGAVLGISQSFAALARAVAPAVAGAVYAGVAPGAPMVLGGALMLGALLVSLPRMRRQAPGSAPSSP